MSTRRIIHLEDDLDGSRATETVQFALDGYDYEIDLNDRHAKALRRALVRYANAGRQAPAVAAKPAKRKYARRAQAA